MAVKLEIADTLKGKHIEKRLSGTKCVWRKFECSQESRNPQMLLIFFVKLLKSTSGTLRMKYARTRMWALKLPITENNNSWRINVTHKKSNVSTLKDGVSDRSVLRTRSIWGESSRQPDIVFDQIKSYLKFVENTKLSNVQRRRFNLNRLRCTVQLS